MARNKILIASGAVVVLAGSFLAYQAVATKKPEQKIDSATQEKTVTQESEKTVPESNKESNNEEKVFSVENLNKKDGDVFSVPDTISYTVTPEAAKSRVKLIGPAGTTLYSNESTEKSPSFSVYPEGKLGERAKGKIKIEVVVQNKVVATKEVQVVF